MLNIATVCVDAARYMDGRAVEAVEILHSMVRRNLAAGTRGRFVVFTDDPAAFEHMAGVEPRQLPTGLTGWWNKLYLFASEAFEPGERVLYFDLDTAITGPLDEIAAYDGPFAILRDAYRPTDWQSSVMAWTAGQQVAVWERWQAEGRPEYPGGDQHWIECVLREREQSVQLWQDLFPGRFRSYKVECQEFVPEGTSVVFFHGIPRPHQCGGWVKDVWKVTGDTLFFSLNVKEQRLKANIRHALSKPHWLAMAEETQSLAIIVGGGPSLKDDLWRIRGHQMSGARVFATNNTYRFLKYNGIQADAHVMHDARADNLAFVPVEDVACYYASQCHPDVLDAAGNRLVCWHPHTETCLQIIKDSAQGPIMVSGGSTIGLNAMSLAYILGYRHFLLFGFDSCYSKDEHHAYPQALNEGEPRVDYAIADHVFSCAPWMVQQAEQFTRLVQQLVELGCEISVYGYGLIPTIAAHLEIPFRDVDMRAMVLHQWLADVPNPIGAEVGVFAGQLSQRLLKRPDLTLYLVDSWSAEHLPQYAASGDFHASLSQQQQEHFYRMTCQMVKFAGARAQLVRSDSRAAAAAIADGSLDFAFLDADHSYEGCRADIQAWLPKIKPGGFISGHDYDHPQFPNFGVKRAVNELLGEPELGANLTWRVRLEQAHVTRTA